MIKKSNNSKPVNKRNAKTISGPEFIEQILKGNIAFLSRAITLIESSKKEDKVKARDLIRFCLPFSGKSIRIGITGIPGVGKSTFIEAFGNHLIDQGKKIAVLAIDPSSALNKGSILGDKTRMENLSKKENAFIRPSPTGDSLGGVAKKTKEAIILCEAAGFDVILIETVGVGQSETLVHSMVDFFLLLKIAGAGDELQGIKRGIMEMADAIVINKADHSNIKNSEFAKSELNRIMHLYSQKPNKWNPKVTTCSALNNTGILNVWNIINEYIQVTKENNWFYKNRIEQNKNWLIQRINQILQDDFYSNKKIKIALEEQIINLKNQSITAFEAAQELINLYKKSIH